MNMTARPLPSGDYEPTAIEGADPLLLLKANFDSAKDRGIQEPGAMALATASADGRVSTRMVQILRVTGAGLMFATHATSPKAKDIAANGWVSGLFYWRETKEQVIVTGRASALPGSEAESFWRDRPRESQAMSMVTRQSAVLTDEIDLRERAASLYRSGDELARPQGWLAYLINPLTIEFWRYSPDRLYQRTRHELHGSTWRSTFLQP